MTPNPYACAVLILIGQAFHLVYLLAIEEKAGRIISPWAFIRQHPYSTASVVMAAYLFAAGLYFVGELTYSFAIAIGAGGNAAVDKLRARAEAKVAQTNGEVT